MTKTKNRLLFACSECGAEHTKWVGKCETCSLWGTVCEITRGSDGLPALAVAQARNLAGFANSAGDQALWATGVSEADRVLGGGICSSGVILLAGEPGIGKSTLALQMAAGLSRQGKRVRLICGEEAPQFVAARAERVGALDASSTLEAVGDASLESILAALKEVDVVFVDSIQTVFDSTLSSGSGSVTQVRECGARIAAAARESGATAVLIGHVTKDGSVAGPRTLEHLVDVVLSFEGERGGELRKLRGLKNRFGTTDEVGLFEMQQTGLVPIRDASAWLLANRCVGEPGSALGVLMDGRRAMVCEIQALVAATNVAMPRRTAVGLDNQRLGVLVAVLERRAGLNLSQKDVYVSVVGGLRFDEPAADAAVCAAIASSYHNLAIEPHVAVFGEVGLTGAIRATSGASARVAEAIGAGCKRVLVPAGATFQGAAGTEEVGNVGGLISSVLSVEGVFARQGRSSASAHPSNVVD